MVLLQHLLMVIASSSKSNHSKAKAACAPLKTGPPAKKATAISMSHTKKTKDQGIKKYAGRGKIILLVCNTSDIELQQMKTEIHPRTIVSVFSHSAFVLFM
jgi:hypothetical protein